MNQAPYARVRRIDTRVTDRGIYRYEDNVNTPHTDTSTPYSGGASGVYQEMTDVVTPDWKRIVGTGGIVNNHMRMKRTSVTFMPTVVIDTMTHPVANAGKVVHTFTGAYLSTFDSEPTPLVGGVSFALRDHRLFSGKELMLQSQAAVKARNNVNPDMVQSLVSVAELHKTVMMVYRAARTLGGLGKAILKSGKADQISDLITGVRRGQAGRAGHLLIGGASRYLEYRYGWRILMMEIQSVIKALERVTPKPRATARGTAKGIYNSEVVRTFSTANVGTDQFLYYATEEVAARAYVLYEADLNYQSARTWGLTEVPLAAWELIPFSFIVDWIIPIGDWLQAITPKVGINVLAEGVTLTSRRTVRRVWMSHTPSPGSTAFLRSAPLGAEDVLIETVKERIPILNRVLIRPYVDVKLNVARVIDAVALIATVGRGLGSSIRR